jgi:hypothetical protein
MLHTPWNSGYKTFLGVGENSNVTLLVHLQLDKRRIHRHEEAVQARGDCDRPPI